MRAAGIKRYGGHIEMFYFSSISDEIRVDIETEVVIPVRPTLGKCVWLEQS